MLKVDGGASVNNFICHLADLTAIEVQRPYVFETTLLVPLIWQGWLLASGMQDDIKSTGRGGYMTDQRQ